MGYEPTAVSANKETAESLVNIAGSIGGPGKYNGGAVGGVAHRRFFRKHEGENL